MSLRNFVNPWESGGVFGSEVVETKAVEDNVLLNRFNDYFFQRTPPPLGRINGTRNLIIYFGFEKQRNSIAKLLGASEPNNWDFEHMLNFSHLPQFMTDYVNSHGTINNLAFIDHSSFNSTTSNHSLRFGYSCDDNNNDCPAIRIRPAKLERLRTDPNYPDFIRNNRNSTPRNHQDLTVHENFISNLKRIVDLMTDNGNFIHLGCGAGYEPDIGNEIHALIGHKLNLYLNGDATVIAWKIREVTVKKRKVNNKTIVSRNRISKIRFFNYPVTKVNRVGDAVYERDGSQYRFGFYLWKKGAEKRKQLKSSFVFNDTGDAPFSLSTKVISRVRQDVVSDNITYKNIVEGSTIIRK